MGEKKKPKPAAIGKKKDDDKPGKKEPAKKTESDTKKDAKSSDVEKQSEVKEPEETSPPSPSKVEVTVSVIKREPKPNKVTNNDSRRSSWTDESDRTIHEHREAWNGSFETPRRIVSLTEDDIEQMTKEMLETQIVVKEKLGMDGNNNKNVERVEVEEIVDMVEVVRSVESCPDEDDVFGISSEDLQIPPPPPVDLCVEEELKVTEQLSEEIPLEVDVEKMKEKPHEINEKAEEKTQEILQKLEKKPKKAVEKVKEKPKEIAEKIEEKPKEIIEKIEEKPQEVHYVYIPNEKSEDMMEEQEAVLREKIETPIENENTTDQSDISVVDQDNSKNKQNEKMEKEHVDKQNKNQIEET